MYERLNDLVSEISGVGPKKQVALNKLGVNSIIDLLTYFPRRYDDLTVKKVSDTNDGEKITVKGKILNVPTLTRYGYKKSRLNFQIVTTNEEVISITFFNQPWLKKQIDINQEVAAYGTYDKMRNQLQGMKLISNLNNNSFDAIYPANKDIKATAIKQIVKAALDEYQEDLVDFIPSSLRSHYLLEDFNSTIKNIHFPTSPEMAQKAVRTAKFMEFFLFSMRMQLLKHQHRVKKVDSKIDINQIEIKNFIDKLPFELTESQQGVVQDILADLGSEYSMNRLLQGDVGSGKTIVATIAIWATFLANKQSVIMAPTEILAEQHANKLANLLAPLGVNIGLLTGSTKPKARKLLLPMIKSGEIDLVIGTHALFQDQVEYSDLSLVIIDEQHRFGVNQRNQLSNKGRATNVLSMTATPIPRTLAMTNYGESDVSIINELPKGRKPIKSAWIKSDKIESALRFMRKQLSKNEQVYVVTPLIEESEAMEMKNAVAIYEKLKNELGPEYKVGLLHGQMSNEEKDQIMQDYKDNLFQVLVSTTVIEVGVDVANATTMVIFDADHFGLAQLHQLRGRVGRSDKQSYCIFIADPKNEIGKKRMKIISDSSDGFYLSQKDLELRGQGDLTGLKQSGLPTFKIGDPIGDLNILTVANLEAQKIVKESNWQRTQENVQLFQYLKTTTKLVVD
ncbi:ATP-dependent DNA helicase RecG [Lentilactobacillus laojiaonis]|uniref:ATP-dependent DNA helicase RecG n=1 Tax=Lentilactobacillus laojiaonis TaxID=2883998 RepID=UPI001D099F26|nr:ATP-dependent DNA helicase RecG [Lentilactobacillus laojiaonis]UDM32657.1 ATP-dependent DNA helicase RecG [Lentilactobacillus laojiaonis]